jgi:hypothetical protein
MASKDSILQRMLYILLGVILTCAAFFSLALRETYWRENYGIWYNGKLAKAMSSESAPPITPADLVGTWRGKESWGTTFVIVRKADGSFTEECDTSHADAPHRPATIHTEGFWSVTGNTYAQYFTSSSESGWVNRPPALISNMTLKGTTFTYFPEEGNSCTEKRE